MPHNLSCYTEIFLLLVITNIFFLQLQHNESSTAVVATVYILSIKPQYCSALTVKVLSPLYVSDNNNNVL